MLHRAKDFIPNSIKAFVLAHFSALMPRSLMYSKAYFDFVEESANPAAKVMAKSLYEWCHPSTVIDVGCGTGALLAAFRELGCDVQGFEYSDAALEYCSARGLPVRKFNIARDVVSSRADLAVSFEVAEHLPARHADRFVSLLGSLSSHVAVSAATPGQGGRDHCNEQPHSYWIEKFERNGHIFDARLSRKLSDEWRVPEVAFWYRDNVMIFSVTQ
jgi:trans-aconitate methyltransferase